MYQDSLEQLASHLHLSGGNRYGDMPYLLLREYLEKQDQPDYCCAHGRFTVRQWFSSPSRIQGLLE